MDRSGKPQCMCFVISGTAGGARVAKPQKPQSGCRSVGACRLLQEHLPCS